jgi:hypothetical protein
MLRQKTMLLGFAVALVLAGSSKPAQGVGYQDSFDSISSEWSTDRYDPAIFASELFDGDSRLRIGIRQAEAQSNRPSGYSGQFYQTQGKNRPGGVPAPWQVSADLYIPSANYLTGRPIRTDLWTRDIHPVENNSNYPILGFIHASPTDPFNPNATDMTSRFRAWDSDSGWVGLGLPSWFQHESWVNLKIVATGSSFEYYLNDQLFHTDITGSESGYADLRTVYMQAYNFGYGTDDQGAARLGVDYDVYWDNLSVGLAQAPVPEPMTMLAFGSAVAGLGGYIRRRRRA